AHMGWLFGRDRTNPRRFAPDLLDDADLKRIDRLFPVLTLATLLGPALLGGLITMTWWGALTAFFWAGLVRVAALHHVTWSVNSLCHLIGERPFEARDRSANFWPLAIASFGESWHNSHHADPTGARHGVGRGQLDISARLIWMFEKFRWASHVRWPRAERLARKLKTA
ncbi:fatty acid desaturase, partial [Amycolatopsis sp. NPDC000740]